MCVATRSRNHRSWLMTTAQPGNSSRAFSSEPRVSTSRSFVGSSSRSRFPPCLRVSARFSRFRSPPESTPAGFCWSGAFDPNADAWARALEPEPRHIAPRRHLDVSDLDLVQALGHRLPDRLPLAQAGAGLVDVG